MKRFTVDMENLLQTKFFLIFFGSKLWHFIKDFWPKVKKNPFSNTLSHLNLKQQLRSQEIHMLKQQNCPPTLLFSA